LSDPPFNYQIQVPQEIIDYGWANERQLLVDIQNGVDVDWSVAVLVTSNIGVILKVAWKYIRLHRTLEADIMSAAIDGFIYAIYKFDLSHNCKLTSYATFHIKAKIRRYLSDNLNGIGSTNNLRRRYYFELKAAIRYFSSAHGLDGIELRQAVADRLGLSLASVELFLESLKNPISLDAPVEFDNGSIVTYADIIEDEKASAATDVDLFENELIWGVVHRTLDDREQYVVRQIAVKCRTLDSVAKDLGISRERVRQIYAKALRKLKMVLVSYDEYAEYRLPVKVA